MTDFTDTKCPKCGAGEEKHHVQYGMGGVYTYCECGATVSFWKDPEWHEEQPPPSTEKKR